MNNKSEYKDFLHSLNVPFFVDPGYIPKPSIFDDFLSVIPVEQVNVEIEINRLTKDQLIALVDNTAELIKEGHVIKLTMLLKHDMVSDF